ncbi:hypothetical protein FB446DRAFT_793449 [Lentinula raphanica]|nr:hypothetical protein C8R42DRAFT_729470 [Lentinula raphanica]KAJ3767165.1 hypothetical protein FB446DRAFT_793449 [Lentinula raphanica]
MSSIQNYGHLINSAKDLYFQIAQIDPPSQNASPALKKQFHQMVRTVSQATGQTYDVAVGMGQMIDQEDGGPIDPKAQSMHLANFDDSDPELPSNNQGNNRKTPCPSPIIDEHLDMANSLFSEISPTNGNIIGYSLQDFLYMVLQGGHNGKIKNQEYEAFRRAALGYQLATVQEIRQIFSQQYAHPSVLAKTARRALAFDDIMDVTERIAKREKMVFYGSRKDAVSVYIFNVVRNIEGLKSYEDWYKQPLEFKRDFRTNLARSLNPEAFQQLDMIEGLMPKEKKKRYNKLIDPVRKKYDKLMDRRRRMFELFDTFGPSVLLDATFFKTTGRAEYPQQSATFCKALEEIVYRAYGLPFDPKRYINDRRFVLRAMQALGGNEVEEYVRDFLDNHNKEDVEIDHDEDYMEM